MADEITTATSSANLIQNSPSTSSTPIISFNDAHHFISIKLTPTNYLFWKTQISLFLKGRKLWGFIDGTYQNPTPTNPYYAQWVQQDQLIMSFLIASLSEDVFPIVVGLETSRDIWVNLEKDLASPSITTQLQRQMNRQSIKEEDHMDHHMYESAQFGNLDEIRKNKDQLHEKLTPCKNTILHVVAQFHDDVECINEILVMLSSKSKQSLVIWKNSKGETALHVAARRGRVNIVQALIEHAKSIDREELESNNKMAEIMMRAIDRNGDTALHIAVRNRHVEVVKLLVKEDPYFTHPANKKEETPLYLAVDSINKNLVDPILTTCKSLAYGGPGGRTAMHAAVLRNCKGDEFGWTPLHYAAGFNFVSRAKQLLEADRYVAYIVAMKDDNKTALHVAACHGNVEVMKELLKYCPDCWEMTTGKGQNVLHLAVDYEKQEVLNFIISNSWAANLVNEKDAEENTPLHLYATSTKICGRFLVNHVDADKNVFNKENLTPLDLMKNSEPYILREGIIKWQLRRMGAHNGYRNIIQRDDYIYRTWKENIATIKKKLPNDIRKQGDTHLIVAALIATVTFAAGFTVPGGYDGNEGPNLGMAVLARKTAFKAFVVSDTIAVVSSIIAVFLHFAASMHEKRRSVMPRIFSASVLIIIATIAMMVAFMTGLFAVLGPSRLAIIVFFFSSFGILVFFVLYSRLIVSKLRRGRSPQN